MLVISDKLNYLLILFKKSINKERKWLPTIQNISFCKTNVKYIRCIIFVVCYVENFLKSIHVKTLTNPLKLEILGPIINQIDKCDTTPLTNARTKIENRWQMSKRFQNRFCHTFNSGVFSHLSAHLLILLPYIYRHISSVATFCGVFTFVVLTCVWFGPLECWEVASQHKIASQSGNHWDVASQHKIESQAGTQQVVAVMFCCRELVLFKCLSHMSQVPLYGKTSIKSNLCIICDA